MARTNPYLSAFNAGEFSPRMAARVRFEQYDNAASLMENVILMPQGGFQRRPGTRYIAGVKDHTAETALLPFQFSTEQNYVLEAGDRYFRFFRNQGQLVTENVGAAITNGDFSAGITGWTDQSNGTGAISHNASAQRLSLDGNGSGNEAIAEQAVTTTTTGVEHVLKFEVHGVRGDAVTLRVGSSSGASDYLLVNDCAVGFHSRAFTPAASPFYIQLEFAEPRSAEIDSISILDDAPFEIATPYDTSAGASVLFTMRYAQSADVLYVAHEDYPLYKLIRRGASSWSFIAVNLRDGPFSAINRLSTTLTLGGTSGVVTVTASSTSGINGVRGWLTTDVGRAIRWEDPAGNWTWLKIVGYTSTTVVSAEIFGPTPSATTATAAWQLGLYSDTTGFPAVVGFFEQRLLLASSPAEPQRFDGSRTADFERFSPSQPDGSVQDDDAYVFTLASSQVNRVRWIVPARQLLMGTTGSEVVVSSSGAALTPSDIQAREHTAHGSSDVTPVKIDNRVLFLQRAGRRVHDFRFDYTQDSYITTDVTLLADHVSASRIKQMAYQQDPDSHVWCVRNDGVAAVLVYEPGQQVTGWSRQIFGGSFGSGAAVCESVASIPGQDAAGQVLPSDERTEVWVIVKRTINGNTRRYIEVLERAFEGPRFEDYTTRATWRAAVLAAQPDAFYVDSGLTYDGAATTTISGLDHLEGETLDLWVDGAEHPQRAVSGGSVTLDYEATKVQAGLPARWRFGSLKLPYGASSPGSTAVVKTKRVQRVGYVLMDASPFKHGPSPESLEVLEFRTVSDPMDTPVPVFTGEYEAAFAGNNENDPRIYMEGIGAGPFVCLAIAPEMATNDFS